METKGRSMSSSSSNRLESLVRCLGEEATQAVQESKVLLVGAGGIGCELIKNLILCGFRTVDLIDLDTIDISNLNRQFLFSRRDVGLSKSKCAKRTVTEFLPPKEKKEITIRDYEANVKEERFGVSYLKEFDLVLNALDNVSARQHVNRLCIAANVPLIDSGTMGYLGQVAVILNKQTKCYDCELKTEAKNKTYAICTIRNTPEKPVHCVVWAKEVLKLVLGNRNDSMLAALAEEHDQSDTTIENGVGVGKQRATEELDSDLQTQRDKEIEVKTVLMEAAKLPAFEADTSFFTEKPLQKDSKEYALLQKYCITLFDALFFTEIDMKLKLKNGYKGAKFRPTPLRFHDLDIEADHLAVGQPVSTPSTVWTDKMSRDVFVDKLITVVKDRYDQIGAIEFEKDDDDLMDLVAALTNLRASVFKIEKHSRFDVKGIAGNIIHAIATTNAIVAGLQTMEAIKIVANKSSQQPILRGVRASWVSRETTSAGCLLQPQKELEKPNTNCYTCGSAQLALQVDVGSFSVRQLVDQVLKKKLGMNCPSIIFGSSELYMEGEGLEEEEVTLFQENLEKILSDCPPGGVKDGSILTVEDFSQEMSFTILVQHLASGQLDQTQIPEQFVLSGDMQSTSRSAVEVANAKEKENEGSQVLEKKRGHADTSSGDNEVEIIGTELGKDDAPPIKKQKLTKTNEGPDDVISLD